MNVDWKKHKFVCLWEDCHDAWEQLCHHLISSAWTGCLQKNSSQRCWTHLQRLFRIRGYFTNNVHRSCAIYFGFISGQQEIDNVSLLSQTVEFPLKFACFSPATLSLQTSLSYPFAGIFQGFPSNRALALAFGSASEIGGVGTLKFGCQQ